MLFEILDGDRRTEKKKSLGGFEMETTCTPVERRLPIIVSLRHKVRVESCKKADDLSVAFLRRKAGWRGAAVHWRLCCL